MNFTGYIDESDTHGPTPDMVMSAMLSTAGRWERYSRSFARIQQTFGFKVFHATEFHALRGEFDGWSAKKCFDLFEEFARLGATHLIECFTLSLSYETYKTHFLDRRPPKMHRASQYGICFMGVLDGLMRTVMSHGPQSKLSVVVEDGHKNAADTTRLFADRKRRLGAVGIDLLDSHAFERKEHSPPLQFADTTAYVHAQHKRAIKSGTAADLSVTSEQEPPPGQPGWTVFEITPDYLASLIDEYERDRASKHEDYLKRRRAWLAGKPRPGRPP